MQEQAHYNTTPEKGWSQMKTILDKEMPVNKRSRRIVLFWWAVIGIGLMGLAGTIAFRPDILSLKSKSTSPIQQVAPNQSAPFEEKKMDEHSAIDNNAFTQASVNDEPVATSKDKTISASSASASALTISENWKNKTYLTTANGKASSSVTDSEMAIHQHVNSNPSVDSGATEILSTSYDVDNLISNIEIVEPDATVRQGDLVVGHVPSLDIDYFTIPENELGPIQASEATRVSRHSKKINPSVEANVLTGFHGGIGWYAGAGADMKLTSTLSLTAGLGYRNFQPGANIFSTSKSDLALDPANNVLVRVDTIFDGYYVPGESIPNASYKDLDPVIESLRQWQAQLGVDWRFSKRFSLASGVGLAFHTRAYSEYPVVPISYGAILSNEKISNSLEGYEVIRETMTTCYAGVTYHIGRHLAVKMQWFHMFQPYLDTNTNGNIAAFVSYKQRDDFIRGITLGMKYSFM